MASHLVKKWQLAVPPANLTDFCAVEFDELPAGWIIKCGYTHSSLFLIREDGDVWDFKAESHLLEFADEETIVNEHCERGRQAIDATTLVPGNATYDAIVSSAKSFIRDTNKHGKPWFQRDEKRKV